MKSIMKYKRAIVVVAVILGVMVVIYFGGSMLMQILIQMHSGGFRPPH